AGGLRVQEGEQLAIECEPEQWRAALAQCEQELRRALEHGFRQPELDEVRADALRALDEAVEREPTRSSVSLANDILVAAEEREVPTDAATDRALFRPAIEALTVEACHAALAEAWSEGVLRLSAVGGLDLSKDGVEALRQAWDASAETPVEAPPELSAAAFAYRSAEDSAGAIADRDRVEDLDLTRVRFENGVRLTVKRTDFRERQVLVRVRAGQGLLSLPPEQSALGFIAGQAFVACGLEAHGADELRRLTAGKQVGVDFGMSEDAFTLDQGTTADDLLLQCELACAYLMHPGWRDEGLREVQEQIGPLFESLAHQPTGPVQTRFMPALHGGDPRFGLPPRAQLEAVTLERLEAWLGPQLAEGPLEVSIVGDVDVEAAIAAAARTFGALPARQPPADVAERLEVALVPGLRLEETVETEVPRSLVFMALPTTDGRQALLRRQLSLLSLLVSDRLRVEVREKLGAAYSPQARSQANDVFPGLGFILVQAFAAPGTEPELLEACLAVTDSLAKDGVTAEELERQREPLLARLRDQMRDNAFWREVLDDCQTRPAVLDELRAIEGDYRGITTEQLGALAARYLPRERGSWIVVKPSGAPAEVPVEPAAAP
ncbi:MAG TPA: insulinase family protein, partial [Planctomycetota bacterium]|nr:insulinase family protein [Planctomycetota bacterium]